MIRAIKEDRSISGYDWAMIYAGKRDKEKTMQWLQKGYEERNGRSLSNLAVHPQFAFLRSEARFQNLLKTIGVVSVRSSPSKGAVAQVEQITH